eukprot:COSAG02_NODE_1427_length_12664_cov_3.151850_10_plen_53_part_00
MNLLEIYNEQVVDLLHPGGREASGSNGLEIRRGPTGVFVPVKPARNLKCTLL